MFAAKNFLCQLSAENKTKTSKRNLQCEASLQVRIKKKTKDVFKRDKIAAEGYVCMVTLKFDHTHPIDNAEALKNRRPSQETELTFLQYFHEGNYYKNWKKKITDHNSKHDLGLSAAEAQRQHQNNLRIELDGLRKCADSALNPPRKWIQHKFRDWRNKELGGVRYDENFFRYIFFYFFLISFVLNVHFKLQ